MSIYEVIHSAIQTKAPGFTSPKSSMSCQHCGEHDDCLLVFSHPQVDDSWLCSSCYSKAQSKKSLLNAKHFIQSNVYQYRPIGGLR